MRRGGRRCRRLSRSIGSTLGRLDDVSGEMLRRVKRAYIEDYSPDAPQ